MAGRGLLLVAVAVLVLSVGVAAAGAGVRPLFRSDHLAEQFLEHHLQRWAGINLRRADFVDAFCLNGYYSKREQRSGHHYPQGRESRSGENLFRSFACQLTVNDRSFNLYLVTTRTGWRVRADR
jgi:hypothetical protein